MRSTLALVAIHFATCTALAQTPDDAAATARDRALAKTRLMLEQRPTHAALFDRYFKLLVQGNAVDSEIAELEERVEQDSGDRTSRIILGRMLLRSGREEDALETLGSIEDAPPDVLGVLGDIYYELARYDRAARAFRGALEGARTAEQKRVILEKLGASHLAMRRKDEAMRTWRRIGELDGGVFFRRLRVAELLAEHGLVAEAAAVYEPLLEETAGDPERHCRVLRDLGRLQELEGELDDALATYEKIFARTARGNWLRKEVEQRTVQIYRRTGRLEELSARLSAEVAERPDDLSKVELLAAVLTEMRDLEGAAAALAAAVPRYPRDVKLARRLAELYVEQKDLDRAIAEYQRILAERPDELELYLELGTLFARSERLAEAKHQWEKALAGRLTDAGLCARIAAMYALWEQPEDAIRLYERAIELEPESITRYTDLAAFQFSLRRPDDGIGTLDRALAIAEGEPRRLELLGAAFREYALGDRAVACFEKILALEPDNDEARYGLAQLHLAGGRVDRAMPLLWRVVESESKQSGYRTLAANTLVNSMSRQGKLAELIADAKARASAGAAFVLGRAYSRDRDFSAAIAAYELAVERKPDDLDAHRLLARLLADQGEYEAALEAFRQLGILSEGARRQTFRDIARLHLEMYDLDKAVEVFEDAMRKHPDDASVYLTVGRELLDINRIPEALAAFRHADELKPNDPDVKFRYADCLKRAAKIDEAEAAYLDIATSAADERDREQARASLFRLYAEQGRIDARIDELRAAIEENVYDADAPPLLADLYLRTGDYVLGLEMLNAAIRFQPRNQELLVRRTELLEALEEWEKAYAAHGELLKFPDADRDLHLAGMGRALFETGKAGEAKELFGKIRDRGRVKKLFDKYSLHDEAIAYFERAIARNPSDFRSYVWLAEQLEKRNRRDEAIAVLERALDIRPFYRRALVLLGKLYVQADRRDDAVAIGKRMFGLRGESYEKSRREEYEDDGKPRARNDWRYRQMFGKNRIAAARQYFEERGLGAEWGEIIVAEAKRRPANSSLYNEVKSHYGWRDKSAKKWAAFLTELLSRDFSRMRIPPGQTERGFRQGIEADLVRVWREDQNVAEARLAELDALEPTPERQRERAMVLRSIGKVDEMKAVLADRVAAQETDPIACMLLAEQRIEDKEYAGAVALLERVIDWWSSPAGERSLAELEQRRALTFRRTRRTTLNRLPRQIRRRVKDADLRALQEETRMDGYHTVAVFSFPEAVPGAFGLQQKIIQLHQAAGDTAGRDAAAKRAIAMAETLGEKGSLGPLLFREGCRELSEGVLRSALDEARALADDPLKVYFSSSYSGIARQAAESLSQILADRGEVLAAFELLTEHGIRDKAALVVRQNESVAEASDLLARRVVAEAERLRAARSTVTGDVRAIELDYRDAVIRQASFRLSEKDFDGAEQLYVESLELLPDDVEIREIIAKLRLRRGDADAAIAMHREIIGVKRRAARARGGDSALPPTRLQPAMPKEQKNDDPFLAARGVNVVQSSWQTIGRSTSVSSNFRSILTIHRDRNNHEGLLETLQLLLREDPNTFRSISYEAVNLIQNQDLGTKKLAILRMLKPAVTGHEWLMLEYGQACIEAGELNEAERTLRELLATSSASSSYYNQQARRELEKIEQKRGTTAISLEELRAKVDADPDNVRHRLDLAKRLKKEFDYRGALDEALIIVERAPYMKQAKTLAIEAAAAVGDEAVTLELMRELYGEATTAEDRIKYGVTLANWLYASGERDEAFEIISNLDAQSGGGSDNFSPGNWFLDRHEVERALEEYQQQIDEKKVQRYYLEDIRRRAAKMEFASGREVGAMRRFLEGIREAGSLSDREQRFRELLQVLQQHPDPRRLGDVLEEEYGDRESVEDLIVTSALALAQNDLAAAERDLAAAVAVSEKDIYLFPLLLGLKRLRGDYDGALEVLDALERVYGGSDQTQWGQVRLSQRDRLKVERAMIHRQKGEVERSDELIRSLADETVASTFKTVADLYALIDEHENALEWHRRYVDKLGSEDRATIITEARYLVALERFDEALELARKAQLMSQGDGEVRSLLVSIHRRTGKLAELVEELEKEFEADRRDAGVRQTLLNVLAELGRSGRQLEIYRQMCELPEERETALTTLISWLETSGRQTEAIPYVEQLIELKGGQEKRTLYGKLAAFYELDGEIDKAEAAFRESQDLETFQGLQALAAFLERHDRDDEALAVYQQMREKDPTQHSLLTRFAEFARERGEHRKALDLQFEYLLKLRGSWGLPNEHTRGVILESLAALPESEREDLLAGGDDGDSLVFAAWLHLCRGDLQRAAELAERALPDTSAEIVCLQILHHHAQQGDDLRARIAAAERLHERVEREMAASSQYRYGSVPRTLRDEQARLWVLLGDEERARKAWLDPAVRRVNAEDIRRWRSDWQLRWVTQLWQSMGEFERALAECEAEFLRHENPPWDQYLQLLRRTGQDERVESICWHRIFDRTKRYVSSEPDYVWPWQRQYESAFVRELLDLYERRGGYDTVREKLEPMLAAEDTREQAEIVMSAIERREKNYLAIAQRAEEEFAEQLEEERQKGEVDRHFDDHYRIALLWQKAGQPEKALVHLREILDFERPGLERFPSPISQEMEYEYVQSGGLSLKNPFSFNFNTTSGGAYYGYGISSRYDPAYLQRGLAIALLFATGERERALAAEREILDKLDLSRAGYQITQIARSYVQSDVPEEAVRLLNRILEREGDDELAESLRRQCETALVDALEKIEDAERRAAVLAAQRDRLERELEDEPFDLQTKAALASLVAFQLEDYETGLRLYEELRGLSTARTAYASELARIHRALGDPERAIELYRLLEEVARSSGTLHHRNAIETARFGLALADAGERDEALAKLQDAVPELDDESELAKEAAARLAELR